jgi:ATP-dependent DNA helicase RecG
MDFTFGPEGLYIEYKGQLPPPKALAKVLISFSNTKGGQIIIGVEDKTGVVRGVETNKDIEEYVMNIASENCEPIISPIVEMHTYKDKLVVIIDVPVGAFKPYHMKGEPIHKSAFIRVGSTNRLADANHLQRLIMEGANETFDRTPLPGSSIEDIDMDKVAQYQQLKQKRLGTPREKVTGSYLHKIGVLTSAPTKALVTCGGLLMFGKEVQQNPRLCRAHIKIGRFKGIEMGDILDHDIIGGTLDEQVEDAFQFIKKHMFVSGMIAGLKREDRPTYPPAAVREVLTNAIIHRDYSLAASEAIMCRIFDDRLEIESPGLFPLGVRKENLGSVQHTINPLIARMMFDMNYFDEWGQGINRVRQACADNGNPPPDFDELDSVVRATIHARRKTMRYNLKERQKLMEDLLKKEGEISSSVYQSLTGISPAQAAKDFKHFLKKHIIKRKGKGRSTVYTAA